MRLILEDEERHHGLLKRMEATLLDALDWTRSPNALPSSGVRWLVWTLPLISPNGFEFV